MPRRPRLRGTPVSRGGGGRSGGDGPGAGRSAAGRRPGCPARARPRRRAGNRPSPGPARTRRSPRRRRRESLGRQGTRPNDRAAIAAIMAVPRPLAVCRGVTQQVVDRERALGDVDQRGEVPQVLLVGGHPGPLEQPDRPAVDQRQPVLVGLERRRRTARSHARPPRVSTRGSTTGRRRGRPATGRAGGSRHASTPTELHGIPARRQPPRWLARTRGPVRRRWSRCR